MHWIWAIVFLHGMTLQAIKIKWESNEEIDQFFLKGTSHLIEYVGGWDDTLYFSLMFKWEKNKDRDDSTCKSHFQVCMEIMKWTLALRKLFFDSCLESWAKASIGYEGAWNILHNTHTKLFHYCQEPLTNEYPGKFFYPRLIFQIFNKEKCTFIIFLQQILSDRLLLAVFGSKKVILVGV